MPVIELKVFVGFWKDGLLAELKAILQIFAIFASYLASILKYLFSLLVIWIEPVDQKSRLEVLA